jgi:hypothetical protein
VRRHGPRYWTVDQRLCAANRSRCGLLEFCADCGRRMRRGPRDRPAKGESIRYADEVCGSGLVSGGDRLPGEGADCPRGGRRP